MRIAIISAVIIAAIGLALFAAGVLPKQAVQHKKSIRDFSQRSGVAEDLWAEALPIINRASTMESPQLNAKDLSVLKRVLDTGKEQAQGPVYMAIKRGLPKEYYGQWASYIEPNLNKATTAEYQQGTAMTLWMLNPAKQQTYIQMVKGGSFPELAEEMKSWPNELTKTNH